MTTRFTNGVTTAAKGSTLGEFGLPDPTAYHVWFDDFDNFEADQWTISTTEGGAGDATEAVASADNGILVITNDAADNDLDFLQWSGDDAAATVETYKFIAGKKLWFKSRFKVSAATQSDVVIGLIITDTPLLDVTDGVFFQKDDGDANLDFHVEKDNTATSATAVSTLSDDTYVTVGFYYNGVDAVQYFVDDVHMGTSVVTNLPDDEELAITFGIQNGEAVAKILSVDYIFVAKER